MNDTPQPQQEHDTSKHTLAQRFKRFGVQFTLLMDRLTHWMAPKDPDGLSDSKIGLARGPIKFGLWTVVVVFGGFGLWSAFAPLESAAVAPGVVIAFSENKTIQHLEGGIVDEILVKEGEEVRAGQPLVKLSATAAKARADLLRAQRDAEVAAEARLMAERDGTDSITFPKELLDIAKESQEVADIIDSQERLFEARRNAVEGQVGVLKQRIEQFRDEIEGLHSQEKSAKQQIALLGEEISVVKQLVAKGNAVRPRLLALQRNQAELEGQRGEYLSLIARAEQSITQAELEIINAQNSYLNDAVTALRETQVHLSTLEEQLRASTDILERVTIAAPYSGRVNHLAVHTVGGVIGPGEAIMEIVPLEDRRIIEARIKPSDIDVVHYGLKARVRLTAYHARNLPPVDGFVIHVSADRTVDQATREAYFLARIEVDEGHLADLPGVELYPGMPTDVLVVTGKRTLLSYLFSPITDVMYKAFREV